MLIFYGAVQKYCLFGYPALSAEYSVLYVMADASGRKERRDN